MRYHFAKPLPLLLGIVICCLGFGCSNSERIDNEIVAFWDIEEDATPLSTELNYLPIDDSEYPYAGIPRIVIETENNKPIEDRETEIPAKMQIWGKDAPESEQMVLTIRGRGNTSWTDMPKKSYKIEFIQKQSLLGMPKDRDWALIANYADKTLIRNFLMYRLAAELDVYYAPRCEFIELFVNKEYLGLYLLTETIKASKKRVNIPQSDYSFIAEADEKCKQNEQVVYSNILSTKAKPFKIHHPKNASSTSLNIIENQIINFELFLKNISTNKQNNIEDWLDIDESIKYYWIQEFSKNPDTGVFEGFYTSVFFSWTNNGKIKMGPVWDFDLSMGNHSYTSINAIENWHIRNYWYKYLLKDNRYSKKMAAFWIKNRDIFEKTELMIDSCQKKLQYAIKNNFKRWDILSTTANWLQKPYNAYEESINDLKEWISKRIQWIDAHVSTKN